MTNPVKDSMNRLAKTTSSLVKLIAIAAVALMAFPDSARALDCTAAGAAGCTSGLPSFQYQMLLTEMLAHPEPNVRPLQVDDVEISKYSFWKVAREGVNFHDAPGGNIIGTLNAGFNYLGIRQRQGDWAEVLPGQWVPISSLTGARASSFAGVLLDKPLTHAMAWMLRDIRPSTTPGAEPVKSTEPLKRYTRLNIFATVTVGEWDWYLVAPNQWIEQRNVARVLPTPKPAGIKGRWIAIDLFEQVLVAYEEDRPVFATLVASGLPKWSTNEGTFRIWTRARADSMTGAMGQPDFYYLQSVPFVMYFDQAISIHGTYWHDGFGYRHSHGCVNTSITDASWLYRWTDNFYSDTTVHVWSSGEYK